MKEVCVRRASLEWAAVSMSLLLLVTGAIWEILALPRFREWLFAGTLAHPLNAVISIFIPLVALLRGVRAIIGKTRRHGQGKSPIRSLHPPYRRFASQAWVALRRGIAFPHEAIHLNTARLLGMGQRTTLAPDGKTVYTVEIPKLLWLLETLAPSGFGLALSAPLGAAMLKLPSAWQPPLALVFWFAWLLFVVGSAADIVAAVWVGCQPNGVVSYDGVHLCVSFPQRSSTGFLQEAQGAPAGPAEKGNL